MNIVFIHFIKAGIILAAIVALWMFHVYDRHNLGGKRRGLYGVLVVLALLAAAAYFDFGYYPKFGQFLNPHDFFHYYLGSKYSREVGYQDLYPAVLVADTEMNHGEPRQSSLRRMDDYAFESAAPVLRNRERYRNLFTPARWEAFKNDVAVFSGMVSLRRWKGILTDKGYNATPVWNLVARGLTNIVPANHLGWLLALDLTLLLVMFGVVAWAFGWRTALFAVILFGTLWPMAYTHIRGAFLRLDWVTMLVMSLCMVKKEHYRMGGALAAYAAGARLFPVVFVFGLGAKAVVDTVRNRRIAPRYLRFFGTFGVVLAVLVCATLITDGLAYWKAFFTKIELHDSDLSPMRVGFRYLFLGTFGNAYDSWSAFETDKLALFAAHQGRWWLVQALMLATVFVLAQHLEDYETIALSYIPAFFLFAPTFYYQVMIIVPAFLFLPKLEKPWRAVGATAVFGVSVLMYGVNRLWPINLELCYVFSATLLVLCGVLAVTAILAARGESRNREPVPAAE